VIMLFIQSSRSHRCDLPEEGSNHHAIVSNIFIINALACWGRGFGAEV
jgi:hypothetical protein